MAAPARATTRCASTWACAARTRACRSSPRRAAPTGPAARSCSTTWRRHPRVLEDTALVAAPPQVLVDRVRALLGERDRDVVRRHVVEQLLAAGPVGAARRGDDLQARVLAAHAHVDAHLVVALAGAAMGDGGGAVLVRRLDELLGDQRPRQRADEGVLVFVERVAHECRQAVVLGELVLGVKDIPAIMERAKASGAIAAVAIDAKDEFAEHYCLPALMGNALYEDKYPLVSALSRPLIAKKLVETAHEYGATAVAHGCTGKGNDQVRIDVGVRSQDPSLQIVAPARGADWPSREELLDYVAAHDIPIALTKKSPYSIDENLWGRSNECGVLEDPWVAPPRS